MDGIILMGQVTHSEVQEWIQDIGIMEDIKVNPKEKVNYASQHFTQEADTWWKMRIAIN